MLAANFWPALEPYSGTILFAALGLACAVNFGRNRTFHCSLTAPFFLLIAVALGLRTAGVWEFRVDLLWPVVLIGVGVAMLLEWRYTRTSSA